MRAITRLFVAASLLVPASPLFAQGAPDPSGHWEGSIQAGPNAVVAVVFDLAKNAQGAFSGTFGQPEQGIKSLPLATVAVTGASVHLALKGGMDQVTFDATLSPDGKSLAGEAVQSGNAMPFTLTRKGDAQFMTAPKSTAITPELEGTWNGAIEVQGRQERLVLKLAKAADGTAAATILDLDGSNVEIPVAVTQNASNVTVEIAAVGGSFVAVMNAGTELVGTWSQGAVSLPLTFKKAGR